MSSLKKSIAIIAALVLVFGPLMQANLLSASGSSVEAQVCGETACCCCSVDNSGATDDDVATRECRCSMSESDEPLDIEMTAVETQPDRVNLSASSPTPVGKIAPTATTSNHLFNSSIPRAGKSPPLYIFACAFLI